MSDEHAEHAEHTELLERWLDTCLLLAGLFYEAPDLPDELADGITADELSGYARVAYAHGLSFGAVLAIHALRKSGALQADDTAAVRRLIRHVAEDWQGRWNEMLDAYLRRLGH